MSHIDGTAPEPVNDARLMLRDDRVLVWCEYGQCEGWSVLRFQGTPGSRYSRHAKQESYFRLGVRVTVADRPGYGASTRVPGRGISMVAEELLRDPIAGLRQAMQSAPATDQAVMLDPDWQRVMTQDLGEALRPGVDGWVDRYDQILSELLSR